MRTMTKKIPKEMLEHWEAMLKGVGKNRGYKEITLDPQVLAAIIGGKQKKSLYKLNTNHEALLGAFYKVFDALPKRQKEALSLYFGLIRRNPLTQEEIAKEMKVSHQNVSLLLKRGKVQLKKRIEKLLLDLSRTSDSQ